MKRILVLILLSLIFTLISCEPMRISTKVQPFVIEPPKESTTVRKIPYNALIILDESQAKQSIYSDFNSNVIYTVEFPTGNLLRQALPVFFDNLFRETKYSNKSLPAVSKDTLIINSTVDTLNFVRKCCPESLEVVVYTKFDLYDSDILPVALPIMSYGSARMEKTGFVSNIDEKDYGNTAYRAIFNSLKNATDKINLTLSNQNSQILEAKQLINKDPSNATSYKVVANLSLKNNDITEALAASQMVIQLHPNSADGYLLLYKAYLSQRKYKDALVQLEKAISLSPKRFDLTKKLSEFYTSAGKIDKAIEVLKKYIEQRPDDEQAPLHLAMLYFKIGRYDESIKTCENVLKNLTISGIGVSIAKNDGEYIKIRSVEPNSPSEKAGLKPNYEILDIEGISTLNMKINEVVQRLRGQEGKEVKLLIKKPETEETFTKNIKRERFYSNPLVVEYMSIMALNYLEINDKGSAKRYIEEAEKISPQNDYLKIAKASYFLKDGQYERAINELYSLKDYSYATILKAIAYAKLGRFEEALKIYNKSDDSLLITNKIKGEFYSALLPYFERIENRAIEYERAGQYSQALKEYARLIQLSTPEKAQRIRSRIARIISANPSLIELKDDARRHFLHAEVLFSNNKFEEAIEELNRASQIQPFNPQIYFNKAVVYEKVSDYSKAIENMEIYLQLNPNATNAQTIRDQIYKWRFMLEKEI
ncbi:MAG: tetratricopeptide repeat protein [Thermodesulfovibrionales bacterium]|nr:tetratricopeptide repeat protein [Thermodesulfovibrionales bacterium]